MFFVLFVCVWHEGCFVNVCQADHGISPYCHQMSDPSRDEEQVTLLGDEGLRAGGQALKLG